LGEEFEAGRGKTGRASLQAEAHERCRRIRGVVSGCRENTKSGNRVVTENISESELSQLLG
jgi:hypothetical protein